MTTETERSVRQSADDSLCPIGPLRSVNELLIDLGDVTDRGVASNDDRLTWGAAVDSARRAATLLRFNGVARGDAVVGFLDNCAQGLIAWWAANLTGAVWAPLNTGLDRDSLERQLRAVTPTLVVTDSRHESTIRPLVGDVPVFVVGSDFGSYSDKPPAPVEPVELADPALVLFSSGTTGHAKACLISHGYLANYARLGMQNVPRERGDVLWTALPLFHLAGLGHITQSMMVGGAVALARQFSVSRFWDDIAEADATFVALMSSMIPRIARAPYQAVPAHRVHTVTGEPFPVELQRVWRDRFGIGRTGSVALGQTEAGFITTLRDHAPRIGTCGLPTDSFEVFVVDDTGAPVPVGCTGELVVRPRHQYAMFDRYLDSEAHGVEPGGAKVWHTGDYVRQDPDGYVYFVDRGTDRIRKSGENIASAHIESVAMRYAGVAQAASVAVQADVDDEILLVITLAEGASLDLASLATHLSSGLPAFGMPDYIEVVDGLPLNASSKVLKRELRVRGVTAAAWRTK